MYLVTMCMRKIIHFQTLCLSKFPMQSVDLSMDTINGMAHFKVIYGLPSGIGKHFIITLCNSNSSFKQVIYISLLFSINYIFYNPRSEIYGSKKWRVWRARELGIHFLLPECMFSSTEVRWDTVLCTCMHIEGDLTKKDRHFESYLIT